MRLFLALVLAAFMLPLSAQTVGPAQQQVEDPYKTFMPMKWGNPARVTYSVECTATRTNVFEVGISTETVVHTNTWNDLDEATWLGWERAYSMVQQEGIEAWGGVATQAADGQDPGAKEVLEAVGLTGE